MKYSIVCLVFFATGCVYGPKVERKNPLNALNGDNYETAPSGSDAIVVPTAKRKERLTKIRGRLVQEVKGLEVPLKFVTLEIASAKGDVRQSATTDLEGKFAFSGVFRNGDYHVEVKSEKWNGGKDVRVEDYLIEDVVLRAVPKK